MLIHESSLSIRAILAEDIYWLIARTLRLTGLSKEAGSVPNDLPGFVALLSESLMTIWLSITILMVNVAK